MTVRTSDENPSEVEIRAQLDRMTSSDHFRTADTPSKLLSLAVNRALRGGEPLSGYELGLELFGHYDQEVTHKVRVHASNVRKKIDEFYADTGGDDLVRIALPPGRAYRPSLTYHLQSTAVRKFRQALAYREYGSSMSLMQAIELLDETIRLAPEYAPAYSARAECALLGQIMTDAIGNVSSFFSSQTSSQINAERAIKINPESWPGYIALGAERLLSFSWAEAETAFAKALQISPTSVVRHADCLLWRAARARLTFSRMSAALAVQMKGFGLWL